MFYDLLWSDPTGSGSATLVSSADLERTGQNLDPDP